MSTIENPFSAPMADDASLPLLSGSVELTEAESIRRQYIKHETSLRSGASADFGVQWVCPVILPDIAVEGAA